MNRGNRPNPSAHSPNPAQQQSGNGSMHSDNNQNSQDGGKRRGNIFTSKGLQLASIILLFSSTVLIVAVLGFMVFGGSRGEARFVNDKQMQAVFLNGGQVYFGTIDDINKQYMRLSSIFYLRVNQQVQPEQTGQTQQPAGDDISLVKLGCELHRPTNEMVINRDQILFWENLKDDDSPSSVPGAVKEYVRQFPEGQDCEEETSQQSVNGNTNNSQETEPAGSETVQDPTQGDTTPVLPETEGETTP